MTAARGMVLAALVAAGAVGLTGCGSPPTGTAQPGTTQYGAPQSGASYEHLRNDLLGVQTTLDDIDTEIAGDSR